MSNQAKTFTILVVDDDSSSLEILNAVLSSEYEILTATSGQEALETAKNRKPDLIILDIIMPDISGFEVMARLKEMPESRNIPIIFITALTGEKYEEKGLLLGAADYITKPFMPAVVRARVHIQEQNIRQMRAIELLSMIDALTEVSNRRSFDIQLTISWAHALREKRPLSLLMLDVDDFKRYNDTYGHLMGDEMLKAVARICKDTIKRAGDVVARFGGEEFAVLLPNTELESALVMAENMRARMEQTHVRTTDGEKTSVTVSIGAASITPGPGNCPAELIAKADACLYAAKKSGKNKVMSEG